MKVPLAPVAMRLLIEIGGLLWFLELEIGDKPSAYPTISLITLAPNLAGEQLTPALSRGSALGCCTWCALVRTRTGVARTGRKVVSELLSSFDRPGAVNLINRPGPPGR